VLLGFLIVAALIAAAEGVLRIKARLSSNSGQSGLVQDGEGTILGESALSWELTPNGTVRCIAKWGETLIYDVRGRTDAAGRRLTPCTAEKGDDAPVAAFFGCSMTFGQGVEDDETLPARFCAHAPDWQAVNYGVYGYGPQHMWLQICKNGALREFSGRRGVVVYSFIDHHLERLVGSPSVLSSWTLFSLPWLESENERIVHRGTFRDRSLVQDFYFRYVRRAHLTRFIENRLPSPKPAKERKDAALDFLVRLVVECKQAAREQAPGFTFCCLVLPTCGGTARGRLLQRLEGIGVRTLDYEHLFEEAGIPDSELFFNDSPLGTKGHFKPQGYDLVAQRLSRDISAGMNAPEACAPGPPSSEAPQ
ncbi:MAG TPA: hypothetical protein PKL54_15120, partial [Candidatus Hydrogenedentes bacterium]|nr:hypothetical protein [Candidatus Hydrogenedentota bacterium]